MKYMNVQRAFKVEMGECTNGGRPKGSSKHKDVVRKYAIEHPDLSNLAISKALNINRNTVNKWLKSGWLQEYEQEHPPQIVSHKLTVLDGRTVIVD
jgi:DNA invertase Pin-like site-specific DNA recombinase